MCMQVAVIDGKTRHISSQLVQTLGVDRDRVVLRWQGSDKDLDMWVIFKSSTGVRLGSVGYTQKTGTFAIGSGTLDVDNWDGESMRQHCALCLNVVSVCLLLSWIAEHLCNEDNHDYQERWALRQQSWPTSPTVSPKCG